MTLTKAEVLESNDLPVEVVEVPEWGGQVQIRVMTGAERDEIEAEIAAKTKGGTIPAGELKGFKARLVQLTLLNGDGGLMFTQDEVAALNAKNGAVINRLAEVAMRHNGMSDGSVREMGET
jgi:hypothetical protein